MHCIPFISQSYRGVFIAQRFTYSLAKIPLLPPNCHHQRIFLGHSCNVTSSDNSRITAGPTGGPISPSGHLAMNLFDQGFGFGLCPSPYPHLVNLRTSAFADSPSPLRRAGIIWLPQVQSLWSVVFVVVSSLRGLR